MAKKNEAPSEALERRKVPEPMAIYDPGLAADDDAGMEGVDSRDIRLPFLSIAQKTSKVLDRSEGKYIPGIEFGDMYNSETREILASVPAGTTLGAPIEFLAVKLQKRARLLDPETNLLGETVGWDDPRVIPPWEPGSRYQSIDDVEGVRIYDWAVLLLPSMDQLILSFKSTSFTAGKALITILDKYRKLAKMSGKGFRPYQVKLALRVTIDKNTQGSFGKFMVELAGGPTAAEYAFADAWFSAIKDKEIVGEEDEGTAHEGEVVEGEKVNVPREKVPF